MCSHRHLIIGFLLITQTVVMSQLSPVEKARQDQELWNARFPKKSTSGLNEEALRQSQGNTAANQWKKIEDNIQQQVAGGAVSGASNQNTQIQYCVAVKQQEGCKLTDGSDWTLEIGEVFPFIRFVSRSELTGGQPNANDREFSLLQIDDKALIAPTGCLQAVPEAQIAVAAMNYKKRVEQYRSSSTSSMEQAAQAMEMLNSMQESSNRQLQQQIDLLNSMGGNKGGGTVNSSRSDRMRMERAVYEAGLARSLYVARQMSDEELTKLYPQAIQIIELKRLNNKPNR